MGHHFRKIVLGLMRWIGVVRLLQWIHRRQIVILMVHGVMDDHDKMSWKPLRPRLSPARLEEYLKVLSRRYRFVSLMDAVDMLEGRRPLQPYSMVLTFDDGYRNNFTHALPILRRYHAPATFFVPTGFLNSPRPFWFDRMGYVLQQAKVGDREVRIGSLVMRIDGRSGETLQESFRRFRRAAKKQNMPDAEFLRDMEGLAAQLESESGHALADIQQDDDWSAILTWEQARQAGQNGVTIGSHTVDHVRLGFEGSDTARTQLSLSKRDIETHAGTPCLSLCYPDGNYTVETTALARECGYRCAVTTEEGLNSVGADLMTLRRIGLPMTATSTIVLALVCQLSKYLSDGKRRLQSLGRVLARKRRRGSDFGSHRHP
jgi:peptidoglycan/xylan/chitin deacetylase (PgdA/CDA1 family)